MCWKLLIKINLSAWITLGRDPKEWALPFSFFSTVRCELPFNGRTGKLGPFSRLLIHQHVTKTARALPALWLMKACTLLPPLTCASSRRGWDMTSTRWEASDEANAGLQTEHHHRQLTCRSPCQRMLWVLKFCVGSKTDRRTELNPLGVHGNHNCLGLDEYFPYNCS